MRLTLLSALLAVAAVAQTPVPPAAPPTFDVASVKVNKEFSQSNRATWGSRIHVDPGTVTMRNVNMTMLAAWAYHVQRPQISGSPGLDDNRYDILAKADHPAGEDELRQMAQGLLAERFKFSSHRVTKQMEVFAIVVPKEGHKMKVSEIKEGPVQGEKGPDGASIVKGAPLGELLDDLSREMELPVINMTGLAGRFDFTLNTEKYITALRANLAGEKNPPPEAALKLTLMEQILAGELGLRLETRKAPVEIIVIDHVEKVPVEN